MQLFSSIQAEIKFEFLVEQREWLKTIKEVVSMNEYEFLSSYWWIFPAVMIILCFFFMRGCRATKLCGFGRYSSSEDSALRILRKRFATGEIDEREFEEKKKVLETQNK